jgi:hypothetical protein
VFAPLANLPIGNSIVFAPLALLCFIMASLPLEGSIDLTSFDLICDNGKTLDVLGTQTRALFLGRFVIILVII